tara:strand:+ start:61 stop:306 length:246 start_codon:yes stop_codon:yes gene_type:complete
MLMTDQIKALAAEMGVSEGDVLSFAACLRVWMDKGYTLEEAIHRHAEVMRAIVNNAVQIAKTAKPLAVDAFYPNDTKTQWE